MNDRPELNSPNRCRLNWLDALTPPKFVFASRAATEKPDNQILNMLDQALLNPLDYPALSNSVFAGDKIAIALQNGLPCPEIVLAGLLNRIFETGIEAKDVVVVVGPQLAGKLGLGAEEIEAMLNLLDNEPAKPATVEVGGLALNLLVHNRQSKTSVSYLTANEAGDPIFVNRYLVDADVVLSVGFPLTNCEGCQDSLYPEFSIDKTQLRFSSGDLTHSAMEDEVQLANSTLGAFFAIEVVEGPGGGIEQVICGARNPVRKASRKVADQVWKYVGPSNVEMVVATIESSAADPSWENFVQALVSADQISKATAPIVIWTSLIDRPNKSIREALLAQFDSDSEQKLPRSLVRLTEILQNHPVYLHSRLSRNDVESLGLGFLDSVDQIIRIAESCNQCIVLRDAHKYHVSSNGSERESAASSNAIVRPKRKSSSRKPKKSS